MWKCTKKLPETSNPATKVLLNSTAGIHASERYLDSLMIEMIIEAVHNVFLVIRRLLEHKPSTCKELRNYCMSTDRIIRFAAND